MLWHHDFEIVPGVLIRGSYDPASLWREFQLPHDLRGTSVADVRAPNGYFSFEARRWGGQVVAFDFRHKDNSGFGLVSKIVAIKLLYAVPERQRRGNRYIS